MIVSEFQEDVRYVILLNLKYCLIPMKNIDLRYGGQSANSIIMSFIKYLVVP